MGLENEELAFQEELMYVEHKLLVDEFLEHENKFFSNNNGKSKFNDGYSNVEWDSNFDKPMGGVAKHMTRLCKIGYSKNEANEHGVMEHLVTRGLNKEVKGLTNIII